VRHFPVILAVIAAAAIGIIAATALWGGEPALQSSPAEPLPEGESIANRPQPGPTPGGKGLPPPRVRLLQNIRNFSVRDLLLDDPRVPESVKSSLDRCGPCGIDNPIYAELTHDLDDDVVVPIVDRRGLITDVFVYTRVGDEIRQVFGRHGSDLGVDLTGKAFSADRKLLIFEFTTRPGDRPCCPSGLTQSTYRWDGKRFVRTATVEL
jgi:hypothetical protein